MSSGTQKYSRQLEKLALLNERSVMASRKQPETPWTTGADPSKFWISEAVSHLFHFPVWQKMSEKDQRTYNQAFALLIVEQFVIAEEYVLLVIMNRLLSDGKLRDGFSQEFTEALEHFRREENDHAEMFWKLLRASDSRYGAGRRLRWFPWTILSRIGMKIVLGFPRVFIFWVWLCLFLEERTIFIAVSNRAFANKKAAGEGPAIDPLHQAVHQAHLQDEARHVQLDEYLVKEFWDKAPRWLRAVNVWMLKRSFKKILVQSMTAVEFWKKVVKAHPELKRFSSEAVSQLGGLSDSDSYQEQLAGRATMPRTARLFDERPELHSISEVLRFYIPDRAVSTEE